MQRSVMPMGERDGETSFDSCDTYHDRSRACVVRTYVVGGGVSVVVKESKSLETLLILFKLDDDEEEDDQDGSNADVHISYEEIALPISRTAAEKLLDRGWRRRRYLQL